MERPSDRLLVSVAGSLLVAVLLGGYTFANMVKSDTAEEIKTVEGRVSEDAKRRWSEHNQILDRQLDQLQRSQEELKREIEKRNDKLEQKLDRLLEQKSDDWYGRSNKRKGTY